MKKVAQYCKVKVDTQIQKRFKLKEFYPKREEKKDFLKKCYFCIKPKYLTQSYQFSYSIISVVLKTPFPISILDMFLCTPKFKRSLSYYPTKGLTLRIRLLQLSIKHT